MSDKMMNVADRLRDICWDAVVYVWGEVVGCGRLNKWDALRDLFLR